ncbi:hypothetical protein RN001_002357 [Aquatica leii]|uniref:DUF4794 domain-containing protein n=1 Tax=Aquatica leii TaxID=1421715 RepID=A0AAN7PPR7_9COLE|nr:hypothetical protein RN001_002357 [Aquatica leii]
MKNTIATILLVVSMIAGQPARNQVSARQQVAPDAFKPPAAENAPYAPRGWRPQGAPFNLPSEPQAQYGPPATAYGTPSEEPTTEDQIITTTDAPQFSKISAESNSKKKSEAVKEDKNEDKKAAYFLVIPQNAQLVQVPQSQNLVYAYAVERSSPAIAPVSQATFVAAPLSAQLQSLPVSTYKAVYSPLSASYVELEW